MANEQNLIPLNQRPKSEQREIQQKGVEASRKKRQEKKTMQEMLGDFLDQPVKKLDSVKGLADKLGIKGKQSLKELFTAVSVLNTLKKAKLEDLETIMRILGEETQYENGNKDIESTLAVIKECAYADRDKQETS